MTYISNVVEKFPRTPTPLYIQSNGLFHDKSSFDVTTIPFVLLVAAPSDGIWNVKWLWQAEVLPGPFGTFLGVPGIKFPFNMQASIDLYRRRLFLAQAPCFPYPYLLPMYRSRQSPDGRKDIPYWRAASHSPPSTLQVNNSIILPRCLLLHRVAPLSVVASSSKSIIKPLELDYR